MTDTPDLAIPLQWCANCYKFVTDHPLIHEIQTHAPAFEPWADQKSWARREVVSS